MSTPSESREFARPFTRMTWVLWIAVSAAIPALGVLRDVLLQRNFGFHFEGQATVITFLLLLTLAAPAIFQWGVLRRLAPDLSPSVWVLACWLSAVLAFFVLEALRSNGMNGEFVFDMARLRKSGDGLLAWPWLWLTLYAAVVALLFNLVPAVVLGRAAKRLALVFLAYVVVGECVAVLLHKLYTSFTFLEVRSLYGGVDSFNLAQRPWSSLAQHAVTLALFGMVKGAVGGYGLMRMFAPTRGSLARSTKSIGPAAIFQMAGMVSLVLIGAHAWRYASGPFGWQTRFPEIRKIFTAAPPADRAQGAQILTFSHRIDLPMPARHVTLGPEGRIALFLTTDQLLRRLDVQSGIFADMPVAPGQSARAVIFSPDGRYVAVNQQGRRRGDRDYYFGRIRLFTTDGFVELKDFWADQENCAFSSAMTFTENSDALWVACERSSAKPQDLLAVKLRLPDLEITERWSSPEVMAGKGSAAFSDIQAQGNKIFAAIHAPAGASEYLFVVNETQKTPILVSRDVSRAEMGGPGFGFCGLYLSHDADVVTLANCPLSDATTDPGSYETTGQFRTFDTRSGNLIASFGRQIAGDDAIQWSVAFDRAHGRFAGFGSTVGSKRGTLVVWDQKTGLELQRIETSAFRSGKFSPDGRWLTLLGRDDDAIHVYRAAP